MARKYHDDNGNPQRYRVIAFNNAFHGRTLSTIAAGGQEKGLRPGTENISGIVGMGLATQIAIENIHIITSVLQIYRFYQIVVRINRKNKVE